MPTTNGSYVSEEKKLFIIIINFTLIMQKLGVDEMR